MSRTSTSMISRARRAIVQAIRSGQFDLGAKLPSPADWGQQLGVSADAVRRVLADLSGEGIVERRQKWGSRVIARPPAGRVCLLLSRDHHSNSLLQDHVHSKLVGAEFEVAIAPMLEDMEQTLRTLATLQERSHADSLVILQPSDGDETLRRLSHGFEQGVIFSAERVYTSSIGLERVSIDQDSAASAVMRHLLDLGHKRIAVTVGMRGEEDTALSMCARHCRSLLEFAGASFVPAFIGEGAAVVEQLKKGEVTALWANNDFAAMEKANRLLAAGVRVPEDVSIVGRNNTPWSRDGFPQLSTLSMRPEVVAETIVRALQAQAEPGYEFAGGLHWVEPELIVRASTGPRVGASVGPS